MVEERQYLPIPVAGPAPMHLQRTWRDTIRRRRATLLNGAAACLLTASLLFAVLPEQPRMFLDSAGIHIDGAVLVRTAAPSGDTAFTGDGAVVIHDTNSGIVATASVVLDGIAVTARCEGTLKHEHCAFDVGGRALAADDEYDATTRTWSRRYDDGVTVTIQVPAGAEPVPLVLPLQEG